MFRRHPHLDGGRCFPHRGCRHQQPSRCLLYCPSQNLPHLAGVSSPAPGVALSAAEFLLSVLRVRPQTFNGLGAGVGLAKSVSESQSRGGTGLALPRTAVNAGPHNSHGKGLRLRHRLVANGLEELRSHGHYRFLRISCKRFSLYDGHIHDAAVEESRVPRLCPQHTIPVFFPNWGGGRGNVFRRCLGAVDKIFLSCLLCLHCSAHSVCFFIFIHGVPSLL